MESSTTNPPPPNLATLLLIKRKLAAKNSSNSNEKQTLPPPQPVTGAHSNEKIIYRQDVSTVNPTNIATPVSDTSEPPKISRKTKQLEVTLLDKKMEEINRKQEVTTNKAIDTWKGFDSLNYGFSSNPETQQTTQISPESTKEHISTPPSLPKTPPPIQQHSAQKHPSPLRKQLTPTHVESPVKDQLRSTSPLKEEESQKDTLPEQKIIEKQSSLPPSPPPRKKPIEIQPSPPPRKNTIEKQPSPPPRQRKANSVHSLEKMKSPEPQQIKSKSSSPVIEDIIPISSIISNPRIFKKSPQPIEPSSLPISPGHHFKLFPDIKHYEINKPKNAHRSIQRSMDRYRFHLW